MKSESKTHSAEPNSRAGASRALFVLAILTGSFLLFLVQPLVARLALPRLGGAPNVWNSAMLVYQSLLLGGYAYAHWLQRWPVRKQAAVHLALLALAALTLPISLAQLDAPQPGWEVLWVPLLLALTIGPVFFLVSAQAPLMQRWFSASRHAGDPYALYAASNLGSFAGLISYPLLFEPGLSLRAQSIGWTIGYGLLFVLVALTARARWGHHAGATTADSSDKASGEPIGFKRILLWLALSAVPSGLMLSTTTHLTTDIFAMPLLWVIPLGLYLLSFVPAFSEDRRVANLFGRIAPLVLLLLGSMAAISFGAEGMSVAIGSVVMLFTVSVALHSRLYDSRPEPARLTLFYLVMSAGGVLGGIFTALLAPVIFDWVWEHPLLVLASALLIPLGTMPALLRRVASSEHRQLIGATVLVVASIALGSLLFTLDANETPFRYFAALLALTVCGLLVRSQRWAFVAVLLVMMLARGGVLNMAISAEGARSRSYFGVYTIRDYADPAIRMLSHGTTSHGRQLLEPDRRRTPISYYSRNAGVGIVLRHAADIYGPNARVGVVGLGTATLACYRQPDQNYTFFEIDPLVLEFSQAGTFTFMADCAPEAKTYLGDARLELEKLPRGSFDVLVIDAFSSDAIPLHLLTMQALDVYERTLTNDGVLLMHISNRYIDLQPVLAAAAKSRGLEARIRIDTPADPATSSRSLWVLLSADEKRLTALTSSEPDHPWAALKKPGTQVWTDDYASTMPYIEWDNLLGTHK